MHPAGPWIEANIERDSAQRAPTYVAFAEGTVLRSTAAVRHDQSGGRCVKYRFEYPLLAKVL